RVAEDFFSGNANWERISEIKRVLNRMPLIGNRDIDSPHQAINAFAKYGVDGIMIARAALGRPWLFKQVSQALRGEDVMPDPSLIEQRELLLRHQSLVVQ